MTPKLCAGQKTNLITINPLKGYHKLLLVIKRQKIFFIRKNLNFLTNQAYFGIIDCKVY
jgi:hypothetical protein